jgi:trk system potassium uptake protein TrkA
MRQVCVLGLGQFGSHLCRTLVKMGCSVLAIDANEQRINDIRDDVHRALIGDARNFLLLKNAISDAVDEAVIALGKTNIEPSILCAVNLKKIGVGHIASTARNQDHAQILRAVGVDEIIFPEQDTAERVARRIATPEVRDMFSLADDYRVMEIAAPKRLHGHTLAESDLRKEFDLLVIAVRDQNAPRFKFLPGADTRIHPNQVLMVMGRELDIARFAGLD